MKHSDSTEMDRLLRRFARRGGESLRSERGGQDEVSADPGLDAHMDADEMNAYAEGELPEGARSRYFAHLADCDSCRKIVTGLTLAAGVNDADKARSAVAAIETKPSRSWREWVAAIFSPPALRYGVPALVLFAVIVVAFVATRTRNGELSVAQNASEYKYSAPSASADANSTANIASPAPAESHSDSNTAAQQPEQQAKEEAQTATTAATPSAQVSIEGEAVTVVQEPVAKSAPVQTSGTDTKDGSITFGAGKSERTVVASDAPAAAAPPAPQPPVLASTTSNEVGNRERAEEQRKAKAADRDDRDEVTVNGRTAGGVAVMKKPQTEVGANEAASRTAARAGASRRVAPPKNGPPADAIEDKESVTDARNVGGRRFQRRGGAWVDTAYSSSRPLTNVTRNSEQYRALVADEPGLRSIVNQLDGEVIVVWKSRAYRFH